jgi:hypothetical protein
MLLCPWCAPTRLWCRLLAVKRASDMRFYVSRCSSRCSSRLSESNRRPTHYECDSYARLTCGDSEN